jgi:hypothetical protein
MVNLRAKEAERAA